MRLDGVINRLNRKLRLTQEGAMYTSLLGEMLRERLIGSTPVATGNLATKMLRVWGPARRVGTRWVMGIGDGRGMGNPGRGPRGTIKKFLEAHPQYRAKKNFNFRASQAWWALSGAAKRLLQAEREQGMWGGGYQGVGSGKAAYFYPQEGSQEEWAQSAAQAGISPTRFVETSVEAWRNSDVPDVLAEFRQDMRRA